jgi:hypothetical protein
LSPVSRSSAVSIMRAMNEAIWPRVTEKPGPYWLPPDRPCVISANARHSMLNSKVLPSMSVKGSKSSGTFSHSAVTSRGAGGVASPAA